MVILSEPSTMNFEFATADRIVFGAGQVDRLGDLAVKMGTRCLVVGGLEADILAPILARLADAGLGTLLFPVRGEPDIEMVDQGITLARKYEANLVMGIGSSSGNRFSVIVTSPVYAVSGVRQGTHGVAWVMSGLVFLWMPPGNSRVDHEGRFVERAAVFSTI